MTAEADGIQWVGPLPPRRTGIAAYCEDLLRAVDGRWTVDLFLESGSVAPALSSVRPAHRKALDPNRPIITHLGNSEHHDLAFAAAREFGGIIVLHDVVLHHALLARHVRERTDAEYWREVRARYGAEGVAVGRAILAGRTVDDLQRFPLSERFIERARLVIVHSEYAKSQIRQHVPGVPVQRVPMGIPLPATVERSEARKRLGIPERPFVVASITHVNPHKRLPVVLRAVRRLAARLPEVRFVIAGSGSDGPDLQREVRMLGLDHLVDCRGYVDDRTARLIAAASDACVNLRYPSTGETSASLLRLLGAGRPVIMTADGAGDEVPDSVAFKVPAGGPEVDIIEELLFELAMSNSLRDEVGRAAREWVSEAHSMGKAVDGYRAALRSAYGIELPPIESPIIHEQLDLTAARSASRRPRPQTWGSEAVGSALAELGLSPVLPIVPDAARAVTDLGLHRLRSTTVGEPARQPTARLLRRLSCPECGGSFELDEGTLRCMRCRRAAPVVDGAPDLLSHDVSV